MEGQKTLGLKILKYLKLCSEDVQCFLELFIKGILMKMLFAFF